MSGRVAKRGRPRKGCASDVTPKKKRKKYRRKTTPLNLGQPIQYEGTPDLICDETTNARFVRAVQIKKLKNNMDRVYSRIYVDVGDVSQLENRVFNVFIHGEGAGRVRLYKEIVEDSDEEDIDEDKTDEEETPPQSPAPSPQVIDLTHDSDATSIDSDFGLPPHSH